MITNYSDKFIDPRKNPPTRMEIYELAQDAQQLGVSREAFIAKLSSQAALAGRLYDYAASKTAD